MSDSQQVAPAAKKKKQPSEYALWIAKNYDSVRQLPLRDRFRELGKRWQAKKKKASAPEPEPEPAKPKRRSRKKRV